MRRALLAAAVLVIFGYQDCGKLKDTGVPVAYNSPSTSPSISSQFVLQQINESATSTAATTISVVMGTSQLAGDLNIVTVAWNAGSTTTINGPGTSPHYVTDTKGNIYTLVGTVVGTGITESIWYAQNVLAATAGTNTVKVQFSTAVTAQMTVSEYSGSITGAASPLDQANGNANTGTVATTGSVTTLYPNELIFTSVAEGSGQDVTGTGPGYRILPVSQMPWATSADGFYPTMSTFSNFFNLSASKSWVATIVTFR